MEKVYDVPIPSVTASTDQAVIARGKHLVTSLAGCALRDCHGGDLGGGPTLSLGPIGTLSAPNMTLVAKTYSDGELVRLIKHGVKKDGRSVRFMPCTDFSWLPESDAVAIVSYVRSVPAVDKPNGPIQIGLLGTVLDRRGQFDLDVARRIDHTRDERPPAPEPTAEYGQFVSRLCLGCHGKGLSGGPIPGAPPSIPIPRNLTPDTTGLKGWSYEDFEAFIATGVRKNGEHVNPFMPIEALRNMNEDERKALWAYLQSVPPKPFGQR
jgi:mono/diheme cytochrome c family protein